MASPKFIKEAKLRTGLGRVWKKGKDGERVVNDDSKVGEGK